MDIVDLKIEEFEGIPWDGIGGHDCYELVRDFYRENFQIELTDYARPHDWESDKLDLLRNLYKHDGFKMITEWTPDELRPGDALCMSINEGNPNHIAIYVGEGEILHHLYGRMSRKEPFHGFWRNHISFILRHPDVPDLRPKVMDVNLLDFVRARNDLVKTGVGDAGEVRPDPEG